MQREGEREEQSDEGFGGKGKKELVTCKMELVSTLVRPSPVLDHSSLSYLDIFPH